jgi:hypothetical protein
MQGGKKWILPKWIYANRFLWDAHWLEIRSIHLCPSMGPSRGSVAMDPGFFSLTLVRLKCAYQRQILETTLIQ